MAEAHNFIPISPESFNHPQVDITGNSNGRENAHLLFDSHRLIFGIFDTVNQVNTSTDMLFSTYDSLAHHLPDLKNSASEKIKDYFFDLLTKPNQSNTDNNIFGVMLPNPSDNYSVFIGSSGNNSVYLLRHNQISQMSPNNLAFNTTKPSPNFYSLEVNHGDILFLTTPTPLDNSFKKKIVTSIQQKQKDSPLKTSQLTKIMSSNLLNTSVVVIRA